MTAALGELLLFGCLNVSAPRSAFAQEAPQEPAVVATEWCALPLCKEAEGLRRQGDLSAALKLYRYIQEEVDVDDKVVRKPLLWFPIAALFGELERPQQGLEALQKYQQYLATRPDSELPVGQQRKDVERLLQSLIGLRLRIANGPEPPPAATIPSASVDAGTADSTSKLSPKLAAETDRHIQAGLKLNQQGLTHSARIEFDQAYELSRRPEFLFNLAQLLLSQRQAREAAVYLKQFIAATPPGPAQKEAVEILDRVQRELVLEANAQQTTDALLLARGPQNPGLRRAGIALLSIGGGLVLTGLGLGIGAVATAQSVASAERFDPTKETTGLRLQNSGIAFDVLGGVSLGVGAVCLGIARRREAARPNNLHAARLSPTLVPQ